MNTVPEAALLLDGRDELTYRPSTARRTHHKRCGLGHHRVLPREKRSRLSGVATVGL